MDSINQQQPEENHKDLNGPEAIKKLKELAEDKSCFFCSSIKTGVPLSVRPMAVLQIDDQGILWFMSAKDSHKNEELTADPGIIRSAIVHEDAARITYIDPTNVTGPYSGIYRINAGVDEKTILETGMPIKDDYEAVIGIAAVVQDITRIAEQLRMEGVKVTVNTIGHYARAGLSVIVGQVELLKIERSDFFVLQRMI